MTANESLVLDQLCSALCTSFIEAIPVSGAALSAFSGSARETMLGASDELAARLDELQFDLGEGPRWEAARSRTPVVLPYVRSMTHEKWPVFGKALTDTEVQALFVFPLVIGALDVGVVELYRTTPGELSHSELVEAGVLADGAAWSLLRRILVPDDEDDPEAGLTPSRREIHQATGMVLAQTGGTAADALLLLRGHAFANGQTVRETSGAVLDRRLDFSPPFESMK
ncbi:GAF and ANTAR domain-containing protein [Arthrobacter sp. SX1312]|uniref:GAF and ANTAR domain-containing protein n=1 Tax=Arthrobacter sp. SX1312 TaxID=2058896 RepID=UPI0015E22F0C|nr:GAF and ANTAR domain-containing protein [Arthrobacter sp. SX1312]